MVFLICFPIVLILMLFLLTNIEEEKHIQKQIHLSLDDTIKIFNDLTVHQNEYNSIFENATLQFLKECKEEYDAKFSLYCFYNYDGVSLEKCTDKFKEEFEKNSDWLRFGFHAYDADVNYATLSIAEARQQYQKVMEQLTRIVGRKSIVRVVRLNRFLGNEENIQAFSKQDYGIVGLLGADSDDRPNYYLSNQQNEELMTKKYYYDWKNQLFFYNTDIRIENMKNGVEDLEAYKEQKQIVVFTHEWLLNKEIKSEIKQICKWASEKNYRFSYLEKK